MEDKSGRAGRKTKTNNLLQHPYKEYEASALWQVVEQAIDSLVKNGDIEEKTHRNYIVGYICKSVSTRDG
jgi:hypothetical protein